MAKWTEYPTKTAPADSDDLMIYDAAAKANKRAVFSGVWNWIVGKLANAVIDKLTTSNKTIIGAINEMNGKYPFLAEGTIVSSGDLNTVTTSGLQDKIYGKNCTNGPGFGCFILNIKEKTTNTIYQIALGYMSQSLAVRSGNGSSGTWTSWVKIYETK